MKRLRRTQGMAYLLFDIFLPKEDPLSHRKETRRVGELKKVERRQRLRREVSAVYDIDGE